MENIVLHQFSIPLRKSRDVYIVNQIKKRSQSYSNEVSEALDNMRQQLLTVMQGTDEKILEKASKYLSLLSGLIWNPCSSTQQDGNQEVAIEQQTNGNFSKLKHTICFYWSSTLSDDSNFIGEVPDSMYELVSVLFNCAAMIMENAIDLLGQKKMKEAYKALWEATGIWDFLERNAKDIQRAPLGYSRIPFDSTPEAMKALKLMSAAHAQEIAIFTALDKDPEKGELAGKLSRGICEKYKEASEIVSKAKSNDAWKNYLLYKAACFEALTYLYTGYSLNKKDKNGEAIKCVQHAKTFIDECKKYSSNYSKGISSKSKESLNTQLKWLSSFQSILEDKFLKQNQMVYHDKIPENVPEPLPAQSIGEPKLFEMPKAHELWTQQTYDKFVVEEVPSPHSQVSSPQQVSQASSPQVSDQTNKQEPQSEKEKPAKKKKKKGDGLGLSLCTVL